VVAAAAVVAAAVATAEMQTRAGAPVLVEARQPALLIDYTASRVFETPR